MSKKYKVISTINIEPRYRRALRDIADYHQIIDNHKELLEQLPQANALITDNSFKIDEPVLRAALENHDNLGHIALTENAANNVDLELIEINKVELSTVDVYAEAAAEFTLGLILSLSWDLNNAGSQSPTGGVQGKTLGIIGYGKVGQALAKSAEALGMKVIFSKKKAVANDAYRTIKQLLVQADILSFHLPKSEQKPIINQKNIKLLRPGCLLINTGELWPFDQNALIDGLNEKIIGRIAIDAELNNSDLESNEQVLITNNRAGMCEKTRNKAKVQACENVQSFLNRQSAG